MATIVIPTDTSHLFWTQTTTLDGVPYLLEFRYNSREGCYYMSISSADAATVYIQGLKLVPDFPLLQQFATPPGEIIVASFSATDDSPPKLGELGEGQRCSLTYIEQADLLAQGVEPQRNPLP
jgi:hypothetical protein